MINARTIQPIDNRRMTDFRPNDDRPQHTAYSEMISLRIAIPRY
jgi:hypothetical protein